MVNIGLMLLQLMQIVEFDALTLMPRRRSVENLCN